MLSCFSLSSSARGAEVQESHGCHLSMPGGETEKNKNKQNMSKKNLLEQHNDFKLDVFKHITMTHSYSDSYDSF